MELVEYEQCPWDEAHVRSIYPIIKEFIVDGEWHPYGLESQYLYRIWDQRIFQVLVRGSESLKREIMAAGAPDSIEDAEWTVIRFDDEYLGITSKFTRTYRHPPQLHDIEDWLEPYALGFEYIEDDTFGVAYFRSFEDDEWLQAMNRLCYIETFCLEVNRKIASSLEEAWTVYREPLKIDWQPGTIYPLPEAITKSGPKSRVALKELPSHQERLAGWNKN